MSEPAAKVDLKTAVRFFTEVQKHLELNKPCKLPSFIPLWFLSVSPHACPFSSAMESKP